MSRERYFRCQRCGAFYPSHPDPATIVLIAKRLDDGFMRGRRDVAEFEQEEYEFCNWCVTPVRDAIKKQVPERSESS